MMCQYVWLLSDVDGHKAQEHSQPPQKMAMLTSIPQITTVQCLNLLPMQLKNLGKGLIMFPPILAMA